MRSVIERALAPHLLAEVDVNRFQLDGPDARLHPKVAVTLAMALHELMTNAAKYGALSVSKGKVTVTWTLADLDDGRQQLDLTWQEQGGPPVTPPGAQGVRLTPDRAAAADGVRWQRRDPYLPTGVVCQLQIPLTPLGWVVQATVEGAPAR